MQDVDLSAKNFGDILWNAWCDIGAIPKHIIAIDPGLRKCGFVRCFGNDGYGLRIAATLDEPLITTYPEGKCVHANKITDVDASATGGNYVRWLLKDNEANLPLVLLENQPPSRVTGRSGRCTRSFANGMVSAFKAAGCDVIMKTVNAYKEKSFGIRVDSDRLTNKDISVKIFKLLYDWFPEFVEIEKAYLKNADVADALILLLSELVEQLPFERICQKLKFKETPTTFQKLHILLDVLILPAHIDDQHWLEVQYQQLMKNQLYQVCCEQSLVQSVGPRTARSASTKRKKLVGMRGVPSVGDMLVNHLIMNLQQTNYRYQSKIESLLKKDTQEKQQQSEVITLKL